MALKCQRLSIVMIKLPAGLEFQGFPRVVAYAAIAVLVTGALFAADGAYRWYGITSAKVAATLTRARSVEAPKPGPVEAAVAASPAQVPAAAEPAKAEQQPEAQQVTAPAPRLSGGSIARPEAVSVSEPAVAAIPGGSVPNTETGLVPETATRPAGAAPQIAQPPLPRSRPELQSPPARQVTRERAAPRRPAQAAEKPPARAEKRAQKPAEKPNVYWERESDSQLGFAPQLRRRTCDPASGNMPMQCYYPREGRERFPAKPVN
jgi:hypothetical protein